MTARSITAADVEKWVAEVKPFTMVPAPRLMAFVAALNKVVDERIPGDIVECGVWRGGVLMLAAKVLQALGDPRPMWLYDTYAGMTPPTDIDQRFNGEPAQATWAKKQKEDHNDWCYCPLDQVQANMRSTGYPDDKLHYVKGDVLDTLKTTRPAQIAILRLDTDWYASTHMELDVMFPLLTPGGYLLVDDFSDWQGSRKAVEDYFTAYPETRIAITIVEGSLVARLAPARIS